jgi:uncharacterized protein (TIGR03083 family)
MKIRTLFLDMAAAVRPLLAGSEVAEWWDEPSALGEMTVGALAGHLTRAVSTVAGYLESDPPTSDAPPLDAAGYFLSIEGLGGRDVDLDAPLHQAIRRRSEEAAAGGPAEVLGRWDATVQGLTARLPVEPADRMVAVLDGRPMRLDDYLVTRLVEMVVHADDLAVSLEIPSPPMPADATDAVIGMLVELARRRHGDVAVVRALTRRERDDIEALRVL